MDGHATKGTSSLGYSWLVYKSDLSRVPNLAGERYAKHEMVELAKKNQIKNKDVLTAYWDKEVLAFREEWLTAHDKAEASVHSSNAKRSEDTDGSGTEDSELPGWDDDIDLDDSIFDIPSEVIEDNELIKKARKRAEKIMKERALKTADNKEKEEGSAGDENDE